MNQFLFKTINLLENAPGNYTGEYVDVKLGRNSLFNFYCSGASGVISLELKNPFFNNNDGVSFYNTSLTLGYSTPLFSDSPIGMVRAISSGVGSGYWASVNIQN